MKNKFNRSLYVSLIFIFSANLFAQDKIIREKIINNTNTKELNSLANKYKENEKQSKAKAIEILKSKGEPLSGYNKNGSYFEVKGVDEFGNIIFNSTKNSGSRVTARVNSISTGGELNLDLDGQNMIVGVWDGGVAQSSHVELTNRVTIKDIATNTDPQPSAHATHVTGTIASSGIFRSNSIGIAPEADVWANEWEYDTSEMATQATEGLLVSNHSYGVDTNNENYTIPDWYFGYYNQITENYDQIAFNAPYYQIVVAAGNDRTNYAKLNPSKNGNDLLLGASLSKNSVIVAAVYEVQNYTSANRIVAAEFSNFGPSDDFRIKPDISAKGINVYSPSYSERSLLAPVSNNKYDTFSGTSMAAPSISGVFILWQQYAIRLNQQAYKSATLRALLVQTADEAGPNDGPDHMFGWGLVNAKRGAEVIRDNELETAFIGEKTLLQGGRYEKEFVINGNGSDLSATIAWTDKEKNRIIAFDPADIEDNSTPALINDLDLRIFKDGEEYLPWKLNRDFNFLYALRGDNIVDNIEKVEIPNAAAGTYTIVVTHKGNLYDNKQDFSIVISEVNYNGKSNLTINNDVYDNDIKIWPNPATDFINIEGSNLYNLKNKEILLFDITGKELLIKSNIDFSSNRIKLHLNNISKGVYFLQIKHSEGKITKKILVQ